MPIFPTDHPVIVTPPSVVDSPDIVIDTASNFNTLQDSGNVIPYITGSPWGCTFYTQIVGTTDIIGNSVDVSDPTLKQYVKINDFELRVTSALTSNIDPTLNTGTITGTANIYPGISPITGDIFIAMVEQGVEGIFEVTGVLRMSLYKESAWEIEYSLISWKTNELETYYNSFVVIEYVFDYQRLVTGNVPLVTKSEYEQGDEIQHIIKTLVQTYFVSFYSEQQMTFLVPRTNETDTLDYDHHLIVFWNALVKKEWSLEKVMPKEFPIGTYHVISPYITLFDVILQQERNLIPATVKIMRKYSRSYFNTFFVRKTIYFSGIGMIYFPPTVNSKAIIGNLPDAILPEVTDLSPYIVEESFYNPLAAKPLFETLVSQLIDKEPILLKDVKLLISSLPNLTELKRFYRIPIIICLLLVAR